MSVNNNIKNNSPRTAGKRGLRRKIYRAAMVRLDYVILKNYIIYKFVAYVAFIERLYTDAFKGFLRLAFYLCR